VSKHAYFPQWLVDYLITVNINCGNHGSIFFLLSGGDGISQEQTKQLLPADLLSFARQSAMGMVSTVSAVTEAQRYIVLA
jgi:hypothetical protein